MKSNREIKGTDLIVDATEYRTLIREHQLMKVALGEIKNNLSMDASASVIAINTLNQVTL
jgi:hypothetical protein